MSPTSYIGIGFSNLDINELSDGGRLLIEKKARNLGSLFTSFDRFDRDLEPDNSTREVLRWFEPGDYDGATEAVKVITSKLIGTKEEDTKLIAEQVKARLEVAK